MNYSRQQLYAFGEPLGDSVTQKVGGRVIYGSGGGSSGPTSSTVTQTNIPDWLRPEVETALGGSMQELFKTEDVGDGNLQITGVKPFVPYNQDPSAYFAGFTPMQEQAFGNVANLGVPNQYNTGTQMAQLAGQGALSVAPQAAGLAFQQAGAGDQYLGMASDPGAMRAFMSPYMQNVVDVQQQRAQRQSDIDRQATQAKFAQSGAFGGGRSAIADSQMNADLMRRKQDIQAAGLQDAYKQAQQAQQYGSQLGLQGLQGAQQGLSNVMGSYDLLGRLGSNVAQIGSQQLGAQKDIIGLQSQMGGQQQQQQQNIINQDIQNFANARSYPLQQYNAFNALLRGYALPGQTVTQYQAPPSPISSLAGLGTAAYGLSSLAKAKGGVIKSMAAGGKVKSMATGGVPSINRKVLFDPNSVTLDQVQQGVRNETISDLIGVPVALQKQKMAQQPPQTPPPQQTIAQQALAPAGITGLPSNLPEQMAKGGIISFSDGDQVKAPASSLSSLVDQIKAVQAAKREHGITGDATPESKAYLEAQRAAAITPEDREQQKAMRIIQAGLGMMGGKSPFAMQNISEGVAPALTGYAEDIKGQKAAGLASLKAQADFAEARRAEKLGDIKTAADLQEKYLDRTSREGIAKSSQLGTKFADNYVQMRKAAGDNRPDEVLRDEGYGIFFEKYGYASGRVEAQRAATASSAATAGAGRQSAEEIAAAQRRVQREEQERRIRADAADAWNTKKIIDRDRRQYEKLLKGDPSEQDPAVRAAKGREAAEAFKQQWIGDEVKRLTPQSQPPAAQSPARPTQAPGNFPKPNKAQIDHLKANPKFAADFDTKFGAGASAAFLPQPAQ